VTATTDSATNGAPVRTPAMRRAALVRRTIVGGGLAIGLALVLWITSALDSRWPVLAIGTLLSLLIAFELAAMGTLARRGFLVSGLVGLAAALTVFELARAQSTQFEVPHWIAVHAAAFVAAALLGVRRPGALRAGAAATWALVPLPLLAEIWTRFGSGGLAALIVLSKIGDIAGYYVGSAIGRHHPFKRLSPGKTTEGCIASFVAATAVGPLCLAAGAFPAETSWLAAAALGAVTNLAAQAGDLLESWVKRRAGVKDSGRTLGPSGGLLDVVDSLLVSVPIALATWPFLLS
jgi:phosphatidate cytidylyltransferase